MTLDVIFGSALALMLFLGWRRGMLRQLLRLVAAIAVVVAAAPLSGVLREVLFQGSPVAPPLLEASSLLLAALLIYVAISLVGWIIIKGMHLVSDTLSTTDHTVGALFGGLKAVLMTYVLATSALWMGPWFERLDPEDHMHLRDGHTTDFVQKHNILAPWRFPDVQRLHRAIRIANMTPLPYDLIRSDPSAGQLLGLAEFKKLAQNTKLKEAAAEDHYAMTLANDGAREFLNDKENIRKLQGVNWERIETLAKKTPEK